MNQVKLYQKVQEKKAKVVDLLAQIDKIDEEMKELYKQCTHESTEPHGRCFSGGYDYKSEDHSWDQCILCGERLNIKVTYGYFG